MARWTDFNWLFSRSSNYQFVQDLESADKDISHSLPISNKGEHATSPEDPLAAIAWKKVAYVALNATSTITITFLNRQVLRDEQFRSCQTSFAIYHFLCTFLVLLVASLHPFNLLERVRLPVLKILPLCVLFAGFLLLGNWSLQLNNIEFYSLAKMMTCPTIVLLNFVLFRKTVSRMVFLSIGLLTGGVMLANHKFGVAHPFGAGVAVMAFSVTAAYQIWIQKKIGDLHVSPSQLLLNQAPVAVLLLLFVAPFTDRVPDICTVSSVALGKPARCQIGQDANLIHAAHVKPETWFALLASGVVASLINVSQFLIIGATSALTFNVVGIVKVVSVLLIGWVVERSWPSFADVAGAMVALGGAWLYASASAAASAPVKSEVKEQRYEDRDESDISLEEMAEKRS